MKTVEAYGLGHYEITGAREDEAAAAFAEGYAALCRSCGDGDTLLRELAALRKQLAEAYDVRVVLV